MTTAYDPDHIATFFDDYGEREWERFDVAPGGPANLMVHTSFLAGHITPGTRVLEVGAGPGRFTIELCRLGSRVTVTDISQRQLDLNRQHVQEAGKEAQVEGRYRADVTDLSMFEDDVFDAVVAFGGPLSYALDRAGDGVDEMARVTRPGGLILPSVMSLYGAARAHLDGIVQLARQWGVDKAVKEVSVTGVLTATMNDGHQLKMYTWRELKELLEDHDCEVIEGGTANHLTVAYDLGAHDDIDEALLDWEVRLSREPGLRDAGTHLIAVARIP